MSILIVYDILIIATKIMDVIRLIGIHWILVMPFLTQTYIDTLTLDGSSGVFVVFLEMMTI